MTITAEQAQALKAGITPGPWRYHYGSVETSPSESSVAVCVSAGTRTPYEANANARAIASVPDMLDTIIAQAAEIQRLTRERDEAVSAKQRIWNVAIEQAAYDCADYPRLSPSEEEWTRYDEQIEHSQENIRALLKDDATAALARRDAQMKAAGMREAAMVRVSADWIGMCPMPERWRNAILASAEAIEKEALK